MHNSRGHCSHCSVCERHTLKSVPCTIYSVALSEGKDFMLSFIGRVFKNLLWILILFWLISVTFSLNLWLPLILFIVPFLYTKVFLL